MMEEQQGYIDLKSFKIMVDGKKVFDEDRRIGEVDNANWLLRKLFKIIHIDLKNKGHSIMLIPKKRYLSCILWNIFGRKYEISTSTLQDYGTLILKGTMRFSDISRMSYNVFRTRLGIQRPKVEETDNVEN